MAAAEIGSFPPGVKRFFLLGAPIIALIIYWILPNTYTDIHNQVLPFNPHAKACLAVVVWMVLWWLFEPVPIPVTSLLPIPLFPLLGIAKPAQAMAPYASGTIFLFMGGFILAIAVQRWRLDKRIALTTLKLVGTKAPAIVGGFLLASGVLSMWVSNTATAAMMVPIAMAVLSLVRAKKAGGPIDQEEENFSVAMLLAVAYGASIGGMATIIGSPPNGIFARFMEQNYNDPRRFRGRHSRVDGRVLLSLALLDSSPQRGEPCVRPRCGRGKRPQRTKPSPEAYSKHDSGLSHIRWNHAGISPSDANLTVRCA